MNYYDFEIDRFLKDPGHTLKVAVIGAGGTGSQVMAILGRMHTALLALNHPGFDVTLFDFDTVSESNVGRQLYNQGEIGLNKAFAMISKTNRYFGLNWSACPYEFPSQNSRTKNFNIVISCVDTVSARKKIFAEVCKNRSQNYRNGNIYYDHYTLIWLDFGNGKDFGQAILNYDVGKNRTHHLFEIYPDIEKEEDTNEPSCSLAQALNLQDLLVNSTISNLGMGLLWKIFRDEKLTKYGVIMNLKTMMVKSLTLKPHKKDATNKIETLNGVQESV